jgi:ribosome recycling factor
MHQEIINNIKPELEKVIVFLEKELGKVRASRANPSLVEDVVVDCFGQKFPLKQLAAISTPEPKQILIQPWDKSYIESIVHSLERTGVGANPVVDKDVIRINLPPLSEEYRQELVRTISEKEEQARRTIRKWREEAWGEIQEKTNEGKIREDDKFKAKDILQELMDEYGKKIEELGKRKKNEVTNP